MSTSYDSFKVHSVVCNCSCGAVLMTTDAGTPAIYRHPEDAELLCAQLRDKHPDKSFAVVNSPVL